MRNGRSSPMPQQMMPQPQQEQPQAPPTIEGLQRELLKANQYIDLFRQQRDRAVATANDLQAELALAQHQIQELEEAISELKDEVVPPPMPPSRARPPSESDATDA
jgi:chromosome segregation ATPase